MDIQNVQFVFSDFIKHAKSCVFRFLVVEDVGDPFGSILVSTSQ